jgi:hypothetical protein
MGMVKKYVLFNHFHGLKYFIFVCKNNKCSQFTREINKNSKGKKAKVNNTKKY